MIQNDLPSDKAARIYLDQFFLLILDEFKILKAGIKVLSDLFLLKYLYFLDLVLYRTKVPLILLLVKIKFHSFDKSFLVERV